MNRHNLAVMFRTLDPNLGHVSTWEAMQSTDMATLYGYFMAIPKRHRRRRRQLAEWIANELDKPQDQP